MQVTIQINSKEAFELCKAIEEAECVKTMEVCTRNTEIELDNQMGLCKYMLNRILEDM